MFRYWRNIVAELNEQIKDGIVQQLLVLNSHFSCRSSSLLLLSPLFVVYLYPLVVVIVEVVSLLEMKVGAKPKLAQFLYCARASTLSG